MMPQLSYTRAQAAEMTGLSEDTIRRAVNAGDLAVLEPRVDGRGLQKVLIAHDELVRWLHNDPRTA
jgi:excisionase family DNA binding protein